MIEATLFTRDGKEVFRFLMPPFQILPEVILWGIRVFCLKDPFEQSIDSPAIPDYYEACAWSADTSAMISGLTKVK